ncbi:cytochrome P450 [Aspergillus crustosus]
MLNAWLFLSAVGIALLTRSIYRLYFHPLRYIPGPKLAAATHLYEFYYDIYSSGRFLFHIEELHRQYGPIVRITPREIHISDPNFYEEIYAPSSRRREKDPKCVPAIAVRESMMTTIGHEHHRFRRNILDNFFSKRSVMELTPMIEERIEKLIARFQEFHESKSAVQLDDAFAALTADIITYYCYGKLWGFLEDRDFKSDIMAAANEITSICHVIRFFPFLDTLLQRAPGWMVRILAPGKKSLFDFQNSIKEEALLDNLTNPDLPPEERSTRRLVEESQVVLGAGTETTGRTLSIAAYHLAQYRDALQQLRAKLKQVLPAVSSTCTLPELEQLPYLTPMSSFSSYFIHRNPTIYPRPDQFDPNRWIQSNGKAVNGERLDRYLTPFTKGSRACLGINLAYAELYMTLAYLVRQVDFELHNTGPEDPRVFAKVTGILTD